MFFFLFGRRYPLLRPVLGLAVLGLGLAVHSGLIIVAGAALTVVGAGIAASLRGRGLIGGKGGGRLPR